MAQFPNRAAWAEHEFSQHRLTRYWKCGECRQTFTEKSQFSDHWSKEYGDIVSNLDLKSAAEAALYSEEYLVENEQYSLCLAVPGHSKRNFVKHVGRHLEQIALMAVPPDDQDSSDNEATDASEEDEGDEGAHPKTSRSIAKFSTMTTSVRSTRQIGDDLAVNDSPRSLVATENNFEPSSLYDVTQVKADQEKHQSSMEETANLDGQGNTETYPHVTVDREGPPVDTFSQQNNSKNSGTEVSFISFQFRVNFCFSWMLFHLHVRAKISLW